MKNEYYIADLLGMGWRMERSLEHLEDVMETGANDVYIINSPGTRRSPFACNQRVYSGCRSGKRYGMTIHLMKLGTYKNEFSCFDTFPEMIEQGMNTSIIGRRSGRISVRPCDQYP